MKKTNKKGFTLVELLAVIVILGVLLLIAVPSVQNIISSSKEKSYESAAKLAIENVETMASTENVFGVLSKCYVSVKKIKLERGSFGNVYSGYVIVDENGKGTIYMMTDGYNIQGEVKDAKVVKDLSDYYENNKMVSPTKDTVGTIINGEPTYICGENNYISNNNGDNVCECNWWE